MSSSPRVLFVEDDRNLAELYRLRLELDGCDVTLAHDGRTGLAMATARPPGVIVLDIQLPELSGFVVLQALRSQPATAKVPVILLSNRDDPDSIKTGFQLGATDYLVKHRTSLAALQARIRAAAAADSACGSYEPTPVRRG